MSGRIRKIKPANGPLSLSYCLKCRKQFQPRGQFNKLCSTCDKGNGRMGRGVER